MENCIVTNLPGLLGKRWTKGVALYGANASGKTTILEALEALAGLVTDSARVTDPKEPISQIEPFALCPNQPISPTAFAVVFVAGAMRYEYRVAATRERIWHESLRAFPKKVGQTWFSRDWDEKSGEYVWLPERPTGFHRDHQLEGYTLSNMLFLSKAVASNRPELEPVFRWFKDRLKFLDLSARKRLGSKFTLKKIQEQTPLRNQIVEMLRHADIGVTTAHVIESRPSEQEIEKIYPNLPPEIREGIIKERSLRPELVHRGRGGIELPLPWDSESTGTHRFFGLAGPWLDILNNGYIACVDELETSMHPLMVRELLRLFFSEKQNPNGAQILFTTHNPLLLDATLLRRDQVWFTDKDGKGNHIFIHCRIIAHVAGNHLCVDICQAVTVQYHLCRRGC